MLTRLHIRNLKRLDDVDIELDSAVVLIGPNNSGKTTALQALALWEIGVRRWNEKREGNATSKKKPERRSGVAINRRDLIAVPVPNANLLWRDRKVRRGERVVDASTGSQKTKTENILIEITVDGITAGKSWSCGMEFDYANVESLYCRPLRLDNTKKPARMEVPVEAGGTRVAFLPPMSGLAATEPIWEPGRVDVLIGEGQTAQVLRNLCHQIYTKDESESDWSALVDDIRRLFGVELLAPTYLAERGEVTMSYEENGTELDLSSSGRGLQQTLLLLAHMYANPGSVLLLDEPDAHLEILRQRQIYQLLTTVGERQGSQIIAASHSEVVLNEVAGRDAVIAFVGRPHRIGGRGSSQVLKSLQDLGFDQYYQAEQTGWVLYLEGSTDLAILQAFARTLGHEAEQYLDRPFVHYVSTNLPQRAREHFYGLREAKDDLVGVALFDRLDKELQTDTPLQELMWRKNEIENYLCSEEVLLEYARHEVTDELFAQTDVSAMSKAIDETVGALSSLAKPDPWSGDLKVTDEFLASVFRKYYQTLGLPLGLRKSDYYRLATLVPKDGIDPEVVEKLDAVVEVAKKAQPRID